MALKKSSLSLESSESDSEELPTFTFLKKGPSSTTRRHPQREEKIVVVDASDSEASCPSSPRLKDPSPVPDVAATVTQTQPVRVLSSGSDDEEEFIPLAERLTRAEHLLICLLLLGSASFGRMERRAGRRS
uniref:Essential meiotic structure-specific endonuclease 1 n=1 Tax=Equus caballus TaxID=9796 RepID=A0A9L0RPA6_HORSE